MKRFFAILLCLVMVCALVACNNSTPNNGNNDNNGTNGTNGTNDNNGNETNNGGTVNGTAYRVGLGMTVESTVSPAEDDDDGRAEAAVTTCALLLDQEGKILSVTFDCVEAAASYNTSGNVTWPDTYKSKKELGYDYGLKKYSSIGKEWFEQVNVKAKLFCPEIAGLFCRIAGLFCHDSRANLSLKPVCFGIAIS